MAFAAQGLQLAKRVVPVDRFIKRRPIAFQNLVGTQHHLLGMLARYIHRLCFGQNLGDPGTGRSFCAQADFDLVLVYPGRLNHVRHTGALEQCPPRHAGGCQDD